MRLMLGLSGEEFDQLPHLDLAGVGMIRGEYLVRKSGHYVTNASCRANIERYLGRICEMLEPRPVWYRLIEMETSEVNLLDGADHRVVEKTTMLGLRGVRRALAYPETFALEAELLGRLGRRFANLHVILPFVTLVEEVAEVGRMLRAGGFPNQIGMMAETPAAIEAIEEFLEAGVAHFTLGMNDLTSLYFGSYRGLGIERTRGPGLTRFLERAVAKVRSAGASINLAGYLTAADLDWARRAGFHHAVIQYSLLPQVLDLDPAALTGTEDLFAIKRAIRAAVAADQAGAGRG
jgi:pyruvate,water dikinase